ncbi:putative DnaJ domain, tetratricopeptide-like helical domain superfamily [Helianthus annuus]|nr:putative DnaJ domain, tetratricopeptide-like helical domain superfamily [Helianthus annuus]
MQSEMKKMDVKDPADVSSEGGFRGYERTGEFEARKEHGKETRSKKKKGKLKRPVVDRSRIIEDFVFGGRNLSGSSDGFDIPPYDEMLAGSYSRETSVTSEASQVDEQDNVSNESRVITSNVTTDDEAFEPQVNEVSETESFVSATENLEYSCDTMVTSLDSDVSSTATSGRQESGGTRVFSFGSRSEDVSNAAEEACEKWRLRGNQAYSNGDLAKAEDCYTQGLNSVSENEKSTSCLRALMLCYSNRAAARMSTGRMKEALGDCLMAAAIDPNFLKVQVRAAHCYLAMGEIENAKQQYMKCLQFRNDNSADGKVIAEASEGLEKVQKVLDCIDQCTDLLQRRASEDLESALRLINDALHISTCSDKLLQMKADSLFMLRRLDEALEFINKQESAIPLADTIRELLSHKMAGNEAYKSGKHSEAVEHYTAALSCSVESRPFVSVCFCNRAAAYRALGQITDGIADCSLAIALDPNYLKAISRRASLYEMIRDYGQAAKDLQRLVSLLTTQVEKGAVSAASDNLSCMNELKQTQIQLSNVEMESRKGIPLNAYLILGVESTASAADIKKAYRKAALKHHPDKAAQLLGRGDDGDDGLWKKIAENVHKDADRLFKMIGEAYAVLSNPSKRSKYDQDEAKRNEVNRFTRSNSSRTAVDVQNSVFEQSGNVRQWQDSARTYTRTQSTGSENIGSSYTYSKYY